MSNAHITQYKPTNHPGKDRICDVCVFVPTLQKSSSRLRRKKNARKEGWSGPSVGRGGASGRKRQQKRSQVAPVPHVSVARARAAPSPGRVSSRAPVGAVLAATLRGILLGVVPGAPPGLPTQAGPGYNSQRTAQGGGYIYTNIVWLGLKIKLSDRPKPCLKAFQWFLEKQFIETLIQ